MTIDEAVKELLAQYEKRDPKLHNEVQDRVRRESLAPLVDKALGRLALAPKARARVVATVTEASPLADAEARIIAETIVKPQLRPVLKIQDNTLLMEFLGGPTDGAVWRDRLTAAKPVLDAAIPAVGRIEVTNHPGYTWVGTGWLIGDDVVVTNRHVAREFARRDGKRFVFRTGLKGLMSCRIDFLEEYERSHSLEYTASEVLWIAPTSEADIAFIRVARGSNEKPLPRPLPLSMQAPTEDQFVATIGYPARDDEFPDQDLARRVFGDVYDKKRLAPGQVLESLDHEVLHDCSTLGGNSGSVLLDLTTGEAVALHYAGLFPAANYAVPAAVVRDRLRRVLRGEFAPALSGSAASPARPSAPKETAAPPVKAQVGPATVTFNIPLEITISLGAATVRVGDVAVSAGTGGDQTAAGPSRPTGVDQRQSALDAARNVLGNDPDVVEVRLGYAFEKGWITDECVVVVELKAEAVAGRKDIPRQFSGIRVDVRSAPAPGQLIAEGVARTLIEERVAKGRYRKPTNLRLRAVNEPMVAVFHVSPDSGFPNLQDFLSRTENRLVATMYEFDAPHVLAAVLEAVRPGGRRLTMVTQRNGGTEELVSELSNALGQRFEHVWASVGNAISADTDLLFPKAYHIKVAVRDGTEFWLSSGNWKTSGQPDIDPAGNDQTTWGPLRDNNREWHAVIRNDSLARQFEDYINYDVSEARRVPLPEARRVELPDIFVPDIALTERQPEAPARYFDPLVIDRPIRIQPLLSPDNYIQFATALIEEAERRIYVQNQSFSLLALDDDGGPGDNEQAFYDMLSILRDRQEDCEVKIIFRDAREFNRPDDVERQKRLLERLKDFGFDVDANVRLQYGCHTKGVVVDSGRVLLGSHNWTNQGALYNRDASLIVYDAEVARYYESIFLFDWENRARQQRTEELPAGGRIARAGEETPRGMRRVSISEVLHDVIE